VKNVLQKTRLDEICERIEEVMMPEDIFILVHLNAEQLTRRNLTAFEVGESLKQTLKIKRFDGVRAVDNVLCILPPDSAKSTSYFVLQSLMKTLPGLTVKVSLFVHYLQFSSFEDMLVVCKEVLNAPCRLCSMYGHAKYL